jgi:D-beta-D-heptose 7-phosphate kinase/D-beta-D-heptose 1-phosphate adenosyltransferase
VQGLGKPRILVVGDYMLDRYVWGSVERISQEAPIPVLKADLNRYEEKPGGAGSVVSSLAALGAKTVAAGIIGGDQEAERLCDLLKRSHARTTGLIVDKARPTTVKTRLIARAQQMLRVDEESDIEISFATTQRLAAFCVKSVPGVGAVVIQDHAKGAVTRTLIVEIARACRAHSVPLIVDPAPRGDYTKYRGATVLTPNRVETLHATGIRITNLAEATAAGRKLIKTIGLKGAVITLDSEGMTVVEKGSKAVVVPANALEVFDVTGAGDVVTAAIAASLAGGQDLADAAHVANIAAGIEVGKIGAGTVSKREILERLRGGMESKIKEPADLDTICADLHSRGRKIVFTNGCFDLLHIGHVRLLEKAKAFGDALIVAINSDASARRIKGPGRPIIPEDARSGMLAALECVDYVTVYGDDTPIPLLQTVRPDVIVKGGEYGKEGVVGGELVESMGGRIENVPMVGGFSTTQIAKRAGKNAKKKSGGRGYVGKGR